MSNDVARSVKDAPSALVTPVVRYGDLIFVSGQLPRRGGEVVAKGLVGEGCTLDEARAAAALSAEACLRLAAEAAAGEKFVVAKITGFVASRAGSKHMGAVIDGASEQILKSLGEPLGRHARSAVGVAALPHDASVEVEMIARIQ
ncbi:enamine deaminase RidA (YjgF/YER057c/UK114 family) [Paenarthrobacter nitroguajacolicus]|uniref:RidA family protein n=1 Tax=Paenarthrobacter nitroguajacolicus TaxID=211146 RepID=UPI002857E4AB|nr:RidA family protein [Paenarthrobacter nitroguajacolicus]MDR6989249.1 enamine deaminase RidA (YjgF/YER057c/UK114 family) [Paenarthrobacter nitroguajacolicus]